MHCNIFNNVSSYKNGNKSRVKRVAHGWPSLVAATEMRARRCILCRHANCSANTEPRSGCIVPCYFTRKAQQRAPTACFQPFLEGHLEARGRPPRARLSVSNVFLFKYVVCYITVYMVILFLFYEF